MGGISVFLPDELSTEISDAANECGMSRSKYIRKLLEKDVDGKIQELISDVKKYISMFEKDNIPTMPLINIIDTLESILNL